MLVEECTSKRDQESLISLATSVCSVRAFEVKEIPVKVTSNEKSFSKKSFIRISKRSLRNEERYRREKVACFAIVK